MYTEGYEFLVRELIWFGIAGPIFGTACALLAQSLRRRPWLWFILGFFGTAVAVLALACLSMYDKPAPTDKLN